MKPINKDAKLLIRSYIDSIEEYLKTKSKMHPNTIDGILNEINDFVYIRSGELAKDKIIYSDVLKAMEECGSPSDICEQHLEDEVLDGRQISQNKIVNEKSGSLLKKEISEPTVTTNTAVESPAQRFLYSYFDQLQRFPVFGFYRISTVFFYLLLIFSALSSIFIPLYSNYSLQVVHSLCMNYTMLLFFWISIFFLLEGWLVSEWKNRKEIHGFNRIQDDRVVITISRFAILILSLKASLLPLPEYFFIISPILFVLMLWMERQQASDLWTAKISPTINNLARSVETGRILEFIKQSIDDWIRSINARSNLEKIYFLLTTFYLAFSWLFPWFFGWDLLYGFPLEIFLEPESAFRVEELMREVNTNLTLTLVLLLGGIIVSNIRFGNTDDKHYKLISTNIWIVRIIVFRTILMDITYRYNSDLNVTIFFLVVFWLIFEFSVDREQSKLLIPTVVTGLKYLGSERKPYIFPERVSPSSVRSEQANGGNQPPTFSPPRSLPSVQKDAVHESTSMPSNETVPIIVQQSPFVKLIVVIFSAMASFMRKIISLCILAIYTLAKPTYALGKALTITSILLFGSILEVILVIVAILTQLGKDGSYLVPMFTFDLNLHPSYESIYTLGGFVIWSWYVLGILAAQIFFLVVIEWLQFARKRDDGVIVVFFRNISRVLLMIVAFGSVYQGWYHFDTYAPLRLFFIIILVIFMEITSLKIRLERKHWQVTTANSNQDIEPTESDVQSNPE